MVYLSWQDEAIKFLSVLLSTPGRLQAANEIKGRFFSCVTEFVTSKASLQEEVILKPCVFLEELQDAAGAGISLSQKKLFLNLMPYSQICKGS